MHEEKEDRIIPAEAVADSPTHDEIECKEIEYELDEKLTAALRAGADCTIVRALETADDEWEDVDDDEQCDDCNRPIDDCVCDDEDLEDDEDDDWDDDDVVDLGPGGEDEEE